MCKYVIVVEDLTPPKTSLKEAIDLRVAIEQTLDDRCDGFKCMVGEVREDGTIKTI